MMQWQPIETAPKDGSYVDLWDANGQRWVDAIWGKPESGPMASVKCWCCFHVVWEEWAEISNPVTHWMRVEPPQSPPPQPPQPPQNA